MTNICALVAILQFVVVEKKRCMTKSCLKYEKTTLLSIKMTNEMYSPFREICSGMEWDQTRFDTLQFSQRLQFTKGKFEDEMAFGCLDTTM